MKQTFCRTKNGIRTGFRWLLAAGALCLAGRFAAAGDLELKTNMLLNRSIFLSWTEAQEETFGRYEVYAGEGEGEDALPERPVAVFDEADHCYLSLRGLEPETEYAAQVRLVPADGGEEIRSGVVRFTTLADGFPGKSPSEIPVPGFMYHHVRPLSTFPPGADYGGWYSTESFERDLQWMKAHNVHTVTSADILEGNLPENPVFLTFDDGYTDFLEYAAPLLAKYGFTAVNAIVTQLTGGQSTWAIPEWPLDSMMTWPQIRECLKQGMEFGGHTQTHVNLYEQPGEVGQVAGSYADFVSALGYGPLYFCYPWGMGGHDLEFAKTAARNAGYRLATRTWPPAIARLGSDPYFFPRQFANQEDSLATVLEKAGWSGMKSAVRAAGDAGDADVPSVSWRKPLPAGLHGKGVFVGVQEGAEGKDTEYANQWLTLLPEECLGSWGVPEARAAARVQPKAAYQKLTFNANGGSCDTAWDLYTIGSPYDPLPTAKRSGYVFEGWFTAAEGGTQISKSVTVTSASQRTVYAHWRPTGGGSVTWTYTVANGEATVGSGYYAGARAVPASTPGAITIPSTLGGCPVRKIADYAFYACTALTSVTIPDTVTNIGRYAFSGCLKLGSVALPESVEEVGPYAFNACPVLGSVTLPSKVDRVAEGLFATCKSLATVVLPSGVRDIGKSAFYRCGSLRNVSIPAGVTNIGPYAFFECVALKTANVPAGVRVLPSSAFEECWQLQSVRLPAGLAAIGARAFKGCGKLASLEIPDGVAVLGARALEGCVGLESVRVPEGVRDIRSWTFKGCTALREVELAGAVEQIGEGAFAGCSALPDGELTDPVRANCRFEGWWTAPEGGTRVAVAGMVAAAGAPRLYARWKLLSQTVTFDANGGSNAPAPMEFPLNGRYAGLPAAERDGHVFLGWFTEAGGGQRISEVSAVTPEAERTLYAHWTDKQVTTFKGNGGTPQTQVTTNTISAAYGAMPETAWAGHAFLGWFTQAQGGEQVSADSPVTQETARTLYAHWTDRQVTTFNGNGGKPSVQETTNTISTAYGAMPEAKKSGHAFLGWFTQAEGGERVSPDSSVTEEAERTLYAHWTDRQVTTFVGNGGSPGAQSTTNAIYAKYGAFPAANRPGQALVGWFTAPEGGKQVYTNSTVTLAAARTLYAHWTDRQVTTFKGNGGKPATQKTTNAIHAAYGEFPATKMSGHALVGWFTAPEGGERVYPDSTVTLEAKRTLYAHWTDRQVTTFVGNGGTPATQATTNTIYAKYAAFPAAAKSGHALLGWFTAPEGGKQVYTNSTVTLAAERTLYAHWTDKQVTTFKGNGGTPATQKTTNTIYSAYGELPAAKKSGHALVGWFNAPEGGRRVYTNSTVTLDAKRTLYAQWTDQQVTTFKGNGGTPATQKTTNAIYSAYGYLPEASRRGCVFQGWYNAAEGGKRVYTNSMVTLAATRTLYAHWTAARGFAITAIAVGADAGNGGLLLGGMGGTEKAANVCRLRAELSEGTEYEIQWSDSMAGPWETVERLTAETDGEIEVVIELPGGETGFFRLVLPGDAGEEDWPDQR